MSQVTVHDILTRLAAATAPPIATAAAPGDLIRLVQDVKRAPDSVCVELLNAGAAEALLTVLLPQPGSTLAVGAKDAIVLPIVEALAHFAAALGYGSQSPALPVDAERLRLQSHSLAQVLGAGDPLLHAFSQSVGSPLAWIAEYAGSEARGGAGRTFDARARRITQLMPLLHASFVFDPSTFVLEGMRCGFLASLMIMLEEIVSVLFLLLPKAIRQQCVQEWACIVRSTAYPAGTIVPAYEAGWDAINNRVKSTNKFGLDINTVMAALASMTHFLFLVSSYPACEHEHKKSLSVAVVPLPVVAIITQATHILERCADYLYHACRMLIRWIPLTKFKASILLHLFLWVEATLSENHPAVDLWAFWWQHAWWAELAARCKSIPAAETHMDLPAWLIVQLRLAAAAVEATLLKTTPPPAIGGRRLLVVKSSCCAERRAAALEQFSSVLLQHPSPADLSCIGTPLGLGSSGRLGGASTIVAGSRDRAAFAATTPPFGPRQAALGMAAQFATMTVNPHAPAYYSPVPGATRSQPQFDLNSPAFISPRRDSVSSGSSVDSARAGLSVPAFRSHTSSLASTPMAPIFTPRAHQLAGASTDMISSPESRTATQLAFSQRSPITSRRGVAVNVPSDPASALNPLASAFRSGGLQLSSPSFDAPYFSRMSVLQPEPISIGPVRLSSVPESVDLEASTKVVSVPLPAFGPTKLNICSNPACAKSETRSGEFLVCSGCLLVEPQIAYCSSECQRVAWNDHKKVCKSIIGG